MNDATPSMPRTADESSTQTDATSTVIDRRTALRLAGAGGALAVGASLIGAPAARAATATTPSAGSPMLLTAPETLGAPPVEGLHLTFGEDPATQMTVSWTSEGPVRDPQVKYGTFEGGFGRGVAAETVTYVDGVSNRTVYVHHARLEGLRPDTFYTYAAMHGGARPDAGTFRTAPRGRRPLTFTSFGDQAVPNTVWQPDGNGGFKVVDAGIGSPAAADIVGGVEQVDPLFHLLNGDLCYANISADRLATWKGFHANNSRSARFRAWMPAAGNHEDEHANGPIGYSAYQARFALPRNGSTDPETAGLWYSFTAGSVHVVVLQNDDVAYQDGGDNYVHGYSGGAQAAWLEKDLRRARADSDIDWIVVCMHQVIISSADANGADLGLRQAWGPLFDRYGVDLVVCGHEHHYERSLAVRGVVSGTETLTPNPVSDATESIDTSLGTVHMVLGGGGTSAPSNGKLFTPDKAKVLTGVGPVGSNGKRPPVYVFEQTPWSAFRDAEHAYGFAAFTVDPGRHAGDTTRMHVTYYNVGQPDGSITPLESFVLYRKRNDG
ncbi:purple acid phosphatase family protein [Streptacidiphilus neutrinimicus]|uniref:purple acid phosphatase family protein n=1 Tax=Streptacidiphilus neutrinimicus TaxID=105420 RepID=UPI000AAFDDAB